MKMSSASNTRSNQNMDFYETDLLDIVSSINRRWNWRISVSKISELYAKFHYLRIEFKKHNYWSKIINQNKIET